METDPRHLTIRLYHAAVSPEEIGARVRHGLLPRLRRHAGFNAYAAARNDGGGGVFAVTIFSSAEPAMAANAEALDWARTELADLLTGPPEVLTADIFLHHSAPQQEGEGYITITRAGCAPLALGEVPAMHSALAALICRQPGFRQFYLGQETGAPGQMFIATIFSNRDTATAAQAQAAALMASQRATWPSPARVMLAGEVLVRAQA